MKNVCINCGTENPGENPNCRFCGAPLDINGGRARYQSKGSALVFKDGFLMFLTVLSLIGFGPLTGVPAMIIAIRDIVRIKNSQDPAEFQSHQAVCVACLFISLFGSMLFGFIFLALLQG